MEIKEKLKSYLLNNSRSVNGICKNTLAPSKKPNLRIMVIEEGKRCKQKEFIIHSTTAKKSQKISQI
jgi:hypothetical protein